MSEANRTRNAGLSPDEAVNLITAALNRRPNPANEVVQAVRKAYSEPTWTPERPTAPAKPNKPQVNTEQREAIIRDVGATEADIWELSPLRVDDNEQHTEEIIDRLFPGNPLLCCGLHNYDPETKSREAWRGQLAKVQFIVPSPMSAVTGINQDGEQSKRCLDNTAPRRFIVCDFDTGTFDDHASLLIHLAARAPLVLVLNSSGKSLHGWFYVHNQPEEKVMRFFRYAASLGADWALRTRCQFVRCPDGTRDNGKIQRVSFLNFAPLEVSR